MKGKIGKNPLPRDLNFVGMFVYLSKHFSDPTMTRLYRSTTNKKLAGVCGGIGDAMDIDPTIIRLVTVVLGIATAFVPFFIAYLIAWWVIPER